MELTMATANTDKLILAAPLVEDTLAVAISSGTDTSFTVSNSWSDLTNGEFYIVTLDRVEPGTTTATGRREVVCGQWNSGTKQFTSVRRGVEGTAQAHLIGKKVEILFTASHWNNLVSAIGNALTTAGALDTTKVADLATVQTLTNKTLTTPTIDDALLLNHETSVSTPASGKLAIYTKSDNKLYKKDPSGTEAEVGASSSSILSATSYGPEGFIINGKISVSVASNNLTVAIKGMDGNDPSSTNKVYVRLGGTVREITASTSFTLNAGTDFFGLGASGHSSKTVYYYAMLIWNSANSVVRIAMTRKMIGYTCASYSTTTTSHLYLGVSGPFAGSDVAYPIGVISAVNSGSASYNWSAPSVYSEQPTLVLPWIDYAPTYSASGSMTYTSVSTTRARYQMTPHGYVLRVYANGTTGGTASASLIFTPPYPIANYDSNIEPGYPCMANDSTNIVAFCRTTGGNFQLTRSDGANWGIGSTRYFSVQGVTIEA